MPGWAILVAAILALAGCTAGASNAPSSAPSDAPPATLSPSVVPEPSVPRTTDAPAPEPPLAELVIDGDRYPGEVGGYTWDGYSQSAPWLPAAGLSPIDVPADAPLSVELASGETGIASWTAQVADATDQAAATTRSLGAGETTVDVVGPGSGAWVMEVRVTYADGRGDGAYYWQLVVP
jgi:hypothetical protein